ncbi:MAG: aminopeptidase [Thermodesulfobacteriota bacterium]|nr:aminopeptidase [Thermodesulfobacteriota bacterium]
MTKKEIDAFAKKTTRKPQMVWDRLTQADEKKAFAFTDDYKRFLDKAKTERKAVAAIVEQLEQKGFVNIDGAKKAAALKHGRYYRVFKGKAVAAAVLGSRSLENGLNIIASHVDSPRLDLKQNPLYEEVDLAMFKIHYYGGIRKYQWLSRPLALYGRVVKNDGTVVDIEMGEDDNDPVFTIADLLPHLAAKFQNNKKLADVFEGEKLNLLAGSLPIGDTGVKDRFRLTVLKYLHDKYKMVEEDFMSAELEAVPAGRARDVGFDRSMIGAYGQDDRICVYTSLAALCDVKTPASTAVAIFYDKEEIGSEGNSSAQSRFMPDFISDLSHIKGKVLDERTLRKVIAGASALSADVNGALDPDYQEVHEKRNAAQLGYGICITKFTGARGKSGANDASAEFVGRVRGIFNANKIVWQTGELGKVDQGGGGTLAKFLAEYGMDIVDCGPALLSMHSPFEISSKGDVYMAYKAYCAFFLA